MNTSKSIHFLRTIILVFVIALVPLSPTSLVSTLLSDPRPATIFGPISIERDTGKPLSITYRVVLPESIIGPYTVQVKNGPNGALKVTSGKVLLNGVQVFGPSDFRKKRNLMEKQIILEPVNTLVLIADAASKPGSIYEITLSGFDNTPEEVVLAEERGQIGSGGGVLTLPDVGEIELVEDATRPLANLSVRKLQSQPMMDLLALNIPAESSLSYLNFVFEVTSDIEVTTPIGIRLNVPATFAAAVPADQQMELYALINYEGSQAFIPLSSIFDPVTGVVTGTLPEGSWTLKEEESTTASGIISSALAATNYYSARIVLATGLASRPIYSTGLFVSIPGHGTEFSVNGNERMNIEVIANIDAAATIQVPFESTPITNQDYSISHPGIDYDVTDDNPENITAAHSGWITYRNQTTAVVNPMCPGIQGVIDAYPPKGTVPGTTTRFYGYGHYATIDYKDLDGDVIYRTLYGHLDPSSDAFANDEYVSQGQVIARGGNVGCSTGAHLHFEYHSNGTIGNVNPIPYFSDATVNQSGFKIGLTFSGVPVAGSERAWDPAVHGTYSLPLDLTALRLASGGRYTLALVIIAPDGQRIPLDSVILKVGVFPLKVTLRWDTNNTDVDLHVYNTTGQHAWYSNLCGIPYGCLDRDDVDGYGPEVFTLTQAPKSMGYEVRLHYYSDHGYGPTTATVVIEVNGIKKPETSVKLVDGQWVVIESNIIPTP